MDKPKLDIREFFNGKLQGWGVILGPLGKQEEHFHVAMEGEWRGELGVLREQFTFSDGKKQSRQWDFVFTDDSHFTACASDVIGDGKGVQSGNSVNIKYTLRIPRGGGINLKLDDWLYLVDEKTILNRTKMKKFGLKVGELLVTMKKDIK